MIRRDKNPTRTAKSTEETADPKRRARRRLIQTLALGGGIASSKLIPNNWIAPAVQTAVLPAHAAGSVCTLGNSEPISIQFADSAGPGPVLEFAKHVVDDLVPEAHAGDAPPSDSAQLLTGCFWIQFICNSNEGTLYATASTGEADFDNGDTILQAPFVSGVEGDIDGLCFIVTLQNGGSSATLVIGDGDNCGDQISPILLNDSNPNCVPCEVILEDGPPQVVCGSDDS